MRGPALLTGAVILALMTGCERRPPPAIGEGPSAALRPKVTVLNADALVIEGRHVRLSNAFAPEPVPDARCWAEALAAKQATRTVKAQVDRAARVTFTPTGGVDEYERVFAVVQVDGADLGEMLFKEGLAARPAKGRFDWCSPLSKNEPGAPDLWSMVELVPGKAAE